MDADRGGVSNKNDISTILKYSPIFLMVTYVVGFIVFNSHLTSYGISEYSFQNILYIKSGVLTTLLYIPLALLVFIIIQNPTDNLSKNKGEIGLLLGSITLYTALILFLVLAVSVSRIVYGLFLAYVLITIIVTSYACKNIPRWVGMTIIVIPPVIYIIRACLIEGEYLFIYVVMNYAFASNILVDYNYFGDNKYDYYKASISVILTIMLFSMFGWHVFKHIPSVLGGGYPIIKTLYLDNNSNTLVYADSLKMKNGVAYNQLVIHENDKYIYIHTSDNACVSIRRDFVMGEYVKLYKYMFDRPAKLH